MITLVSARLNKLAVFENPASFGGCSACCGGEQNSLGVTGSDWLQRRAKGLFPENLNLKLTSINSWRLGAGLWLGNLDYIPVTGLLVFLIFYFLCVCFCICKTRPALLNFPRFTLGKRCVKIELFFSLLDYFFSQSLGENRSLSLRAAVVFLFCFVFLTTSTCNQVLLPAALHGWSPGNLGSRLLLNS